MREGVTTNIVWRRLFLDVPSLSSSPSEVMNERLVGWLYNKVNKQRLFTSLQSWWDNRPGLRDAAGLQAPHAGLCYAFQPTPKRLIKLNPACSEHAWLYNTIQWIGKMEDNSARIIETDSRRSSISTNNHQITFWGRISWPGHFEVEVGVCVIFSLYCICKGGLLQVVGNYMFYEFWSTIDGVCIELETLRLWGSRGLDGSI